MRKCFLLVSLFCLLVRVSPAQDSPDPSPAFDSLALMRDLLQLLDSAPPARSYGMMSLGISNRLFSLRNNRLNASQSATSTLVYNPSVGYFHRSGFSLSAGASLLNDMVQGFRASQFSITPAWDLTGQSHWDLGIAYTYYKVTDAYSIYANPVQHDLYAQAAYRKGWLQPGLAAGYSAGTFKEIFTIRLPGGNTFIDTGTYRLRAFSLTPSVGHEFFREGVLTKNDALSFRGTLMLNLASDSTRSLSHTIGPNLLRFLSRRRRIPRLQGSNSFRAQSVGFSADLTYSTGRWTIMPQGYLDYYLPATDEKRLTATFAVTAGYRF